MGYPTGREYQGHGYHGRGCGYGKGHHECPICGMPHGGEGGYGGMKRGHGHLAEKAVKKVLLEKMKAKIEDRWGDKLDEIAEELVSLAEEKKKMKKGIWERKLAVKQRLHEILAEEGETGEPE